MTTKHEIISRFQQKAASKTGWWTFGLGVALVVVWPLFNFFATVVRPLIARAMGRAPGGSMGLGLGILSLLLAFTTLGLGIRALRKGERSWAVWLGFIPSVLASVFWVFMIVGEFVYPH